MTTRRRRLAFLGAGFVDQALYAGTNFAAAVVAARVLGPDDFGAFSVALGIYTTAWILSRSVIGEPFVLQSASLSATDGARAAARAFVATLLFALAGALAVAVAAATVVADPVTRRTLLSLCAWLPILLLQDQARVVAFAQRQAPVAVVSDGIWAVTQLAVLGGLAGLGLLTAPLAVSAWAVGALTGGLYAAWRLRLWNAGTREAAQWLRDAAANGVWFASARGMLTAGTQLTLPIAASLAGSAAAGGLRGVMTLFGPLGVLARGLHLTALPELAETDPTAVWKVARNRSLFLVAVCVAYLAAVVAGGETLLRAVLGVEFTPYVVLLLPLAIAQASETGTSLLTLTLRRMGTVRPVAVLEAVFASARLAGSALVASHTGPLGIAYVLAGTGLARALVVTALARRATAGQT
ncbi:MAG: hypothetical protein KF709_01195 [Gemmatimonadaceae bacterium]|nr:hypothetical protein [Gemmatimonadaceae bacterium]